MPSTYASRRHLRGEGELRAAHPPLPLARWRPAPACGSEIDVGGRLRALRESRELSLRELAEKSGLALNTVSLIENAKTSPSVGTLQQLAVALQVPITTFFETDLPKRSVVYLPAARRPRVTFEHGILEDLGSGLADRAVEPFLITLRPNMGSGLHAVVHTGYEFVYCLRGRITYTLEDLVYVLEPGDSLLFEAVLPHCWGNQEQVLAQALLVLYPGDAHDHPTERHFAPRGADGEAMEQVSGDDKARPRKGQKPGANKGYRRFRRGLGEALA